MKAANSRFFYVAFFWFRHRRATPCDHAPSGLYELPAQYKFTARHTALTS